MGHAALGDAHAAALQLGMQLRHAAALAVAQAADQGDDSEAELAVRQRPGALFLRSLGLVVAGARRIGAAADAQYEPAEARQRHDGPGVVIGDP
jgi:hypothetical protein